MNILGVIVMLLILVAILFSGHFFIYFSCVKFFDIETVRVKFWLAFALFIFGTSFFGASILAHYSENSFTKLGYFFSSLWLGIGWNIILAFCLLWLMIYITRILNISTNHKQVAIVFLVLSMFYSAYGIWCAHNPRVKNITVKMRNLPESWKDKRAVQLSDVHLGHIYGKDFLSKIIKITNEQKPNLVFLTGDLFDGMDGALDALTSPLNEIQAPDGTYFVTGNHETYLGVEKSLAVFEKTPVKVLNNAIANVSGVQILGISYPKREEKQNFKEVVKGVKDFNSDAPNILLYHNPAVAIEAKELGIDLQLSGHTHSGQLFPFQLITRLIYGKYYYGLHEEDDFSIYTSVGVGTWGPMMRTSGRPEIVVINFAELK